MKLFSPLRANGMTLPNRLVVPAMVTRLSGEDGFVNGPITERYTRFARGGAGLVVLEAMAVHGSKSGPLLRISGDEFLPGLRDLAARMHDAGPGRCAPQIIHFLKISRTGWRQRVNDLTIDEVRVIPGLYAAAAVRARSAGYDAVELHMAHAYTLSSFLSRLNARRDDYGGSLERRLRLPLETLAAVRAAAGQDFPVGVRFDGEECVKGGYTVDEARWIALALARAGADWLSISAGGKFEDALPRAGQPLYPYTGYSGERCMPGRNYPPAANLYIAAGIKAFLVQHGLGTPVVATGKIHTPELAESILGDGKADLIGMARPLLADPDWPRKVQSGRFDRVIRCCYANVCKAKDEHFQTVTCFLWPRGAINAPHSDDQTPPQWPGGDAALTVRAEAGRVSLKWQAATDNEAVYGYDIWRAVENGPPERMDAVPAGVCAYHDGGVVGGMRYRYGVQAYDLAGNRGAMSAEIEVLVPPGAPAGIQSGGQV
ncbi:MAG: NADH:flavin oxidoreductase [Planctomycetes bacterium]|jgi:2,4-dienoyl-CoA reductase-like NADH-dependent reductase (Old Yellow Enzyme family)|nr:NADH:flavin oxidoreductase [Planctomycetota bacterium]MCL4731105.1 NADH:flavin oxidoreductase [Planctomycetota bacterium]